MHVNNKPVKLKVNHFTLTNLIVCVQLLTQFAPIFKYLHTIVFISMHFPNRNHCWIPLVSWALFLLRCLTTEIIQSKYAEIITHSLSDYEKQDLSEAAKLRVWKVTELSTRVLLTDSCGTRVRCCCFSHVNMIPRWKAVVHSGSWQTGCRHYISGHTSISQHVSNTSYIITNSSNTHRCLYKLNPATCA